MALEVLHITSHDSRGGASRAAARLHFSLLNIGIKSKMFVQQKSSNAPTILTENNFFVRKINRIFSFVDTLPARILQKNINNYSPSIIGSIGLVKKINKLNDVRALPAKLLGNDNPTAGWVTDKKIELKINNVI